MPYEWQTAKPDVCPTCNGKGYVAEYTAGRAVCSRCAGSGVLYHVTHYTVTAESLRTMKTPYELINELRTEIDILKARIDALDHEDRTHAD